eukprot:GILJ01010670.1.p1 GENE.GILJ01010670.1~~GILJ01010670.1.p1  ORF type:complete len:1834 (-),score=218.05 GILJ01010670.1:170-5242(-)
MKSIVLNITWAVVDVLCVCLLVLSVMLSPWTVCQTARQPRPSSRSQFRKDVIQSFKSSLLSLFYVFVDTVCLLLYILALVIAPWRTVHLYKNRPLNRVEFREKAAAVVLQSIISTCRGFVELCLDLLCSCIYLIAVAIAPWTVKAIYTERPHSRQEFRVGSWKALERSVTVVFNVIISALGSGILIWLGLVTVFAFLLAPWTFIGVQRPAEEDMLNFPFMRLAISFWFWVDSILNLFATVFLLLSCVCVHRIPAVVRNIPRISLEYKRYCFQQFCISVTELLWIMLLCFCLCLLTLCMVAPWRLSAIIRTFPKQRKDLFIFSVQQLFCSVLDVVTVLVVPVVCIAVWRVGSLIRELRRAYEQPSKNSLEWNCSVNQVVFSELACSCFDLICLPFGLLCFISVIETVPFLLRCAKVFQEHRTAQYNIQLRIACLTHFLLIFVDSFLLILSCVLLASGVRTVPMARIALHLGSCVKSDHAESSRMQIVTQFCQLLIDLLFVPFALFVTVSLWRLPVCIYNCYNSSTASARRKETVLQSVNAILDLPFVVLLFVIMASLYRIPCWVMDINRHITSLVTPEVDSAVSNSRLNRFYGEFRASTCRQFLELIYDLGFAALFLLTLVTPWRTIAILRTVFQSELKHTQRSSLRQLQGLTYSQRTWTKDVARYDEICERGLKDSASLEEVISKMSRTSHYKSHSRPKSISNLDVESGTNRIIEISKRLQRLRLVLMCTYVSCFKFLLVDNVPVGARRNAYILAKEVLNQQMKSIDSQLDQVYAETSQRKAYFQDAMREVQLTIRDFSLLYRKSIIQNLKGSFADFLSGISFLTVLATVYRFPSMIRLMNRAEGVYWKKAVVNRCAVEVLYDLFALVGAVFVIVLIRRAGSMLIDLRDSTMTAKELRHIVWTYVGIALQDILNIFRFVTVWELYKFILATVVYGVFTPIEMIDQMLTTAIRQDRFKWIRFRVAVLIWIALAVCPFVFILKLSPNSFDINDPESHNRLMLIYVSCYLAALLFLAFLSIRVASREDRYRCIPADIRVMRFSWANVFVVGSITVETLQLCLFALNQLLPNDPSDPSIESTPTLQTIQSFSQVFTLMLKRTSFELMFWITVAAVGVWYLVIASPIVLEYLLEWVPVGSISKSSGWKSVVGLLGTTFHIPIIINLLQPVACVYSDTYPELRVDPSVFCWQAYYDSTSGSLSVSQPTMALLALLLLAFYILTSQIISSANGYMPVNTDESLDARFPLMYILCISSTKAFLTVCRAMFGSIQSVFLVILLVVSLLLALFTLWFETVFRSPVCSIAWVKGLRVSSFLLVAWTALVCLIGEATYDLTSESDYRDLVIKFGLPGWLIILVAFFVYFLLCFSREKKLASVVDSAMIQAVKLELIRLEVELTAEQLFLPAWEDNNKRQKKWMKEVENGIRPLAFAKLAVQLEDQISIEACTKTWISKRLQWRKDLQRFYDISWSMLLKNLQLFLLSTNRKRFKRPAVIPPISVTPDDRGWRLDVAAVLRLSNTTLRRLIDDVMSEHKDLSTYKHESTREPALQHAVGFQKPVEHPDQNMIHTSRVQSVHMTPSVSPIQVFHPVCHIATNSFCNGSELASVASGTGLTSFAEFLEPLELNVEPLGLELQGETMNPLPAVEKSIQCDSTVDISDSNARNSDPSCEDPVVAPQRSVPTDTTSNETFDDAVVIDL